MDAAESEARTIPAIAFMIFLGVVLLVSLQILDTHCKSTKHNG